MGKRLILSGLIGFLVVILLFGNSTTTQGNSWTEWGAVVVSTESTGTSQFPSLAVDSQNNVHITWHDSTDYLSSGADWDIFYKYRNATTGVWSTTEVVSTESTGTSQYPSLAVDSLGNVHVAWHDNTDYLSSGIDYDIFYKYRNATTDVWSTTEVVSIESTGNSLNPSLAVDSQGNVHIAWFDDTNYLGSGADYDIFYKYWNATTDVWSTTEVVFIESTGASQYPSLAVDSQGNVHVAWHDNTDYLGSGADYDVFYKYRNATTDVWSTTEVVSIESTGHSQRPSLAVDSQNNVHIAWHDFTDYLGSGADWDIFYKYRNATTGVWSTTEVVSTESTGISQYPSLAVDSLGNVHVAWHDNTDYLGSGSTDYDIFYKYRNATTDVWSTTEVVSTESTGSSAVPSLVVDSLGNVHIAWYDLTDYAGSGSTDYDIFYKLSVNLDAIPTTVTDTLTQTESVTDTLTQTDTQIQTVTSTQTETSVTTQPGTTETSVLTSNQTVFNTITETSVVTSNQAGNTITTTNTESTPLAILPVLTGIILGKRIRKKRR